MAFGRRERINVRDAVAGSLLPEATPHATSPCATVPAGTAWASHLNSAGARILHSKTLSSFALPHAFAAFAPKSVPSTHMRWSVTAILRASATRAFLKPARLASFAPQLFNGLVPRDRESMTFAAS